VNFLSQASKDYALDSMKSVATRTNPVRCFVSDSKTAVMVQGLPPTLVDAAVAKIELERIGGPMVGEPAMQKPGMWQASYINYRRAEKALALLNGKPYGPLGGTPPMNASLAVGKQSGTAQMPPKSVAAPPMGAGGKPPVTLFIKNISAVIDEAALASVTGRKETGAALQSGRHSKMQMRTDGAWMSR
jgi:hypothetical protein